MPLDRLRQLYPHFGVALAMLFACAVAPACADPRPAPPATCSPFSAPAPIEQRYTELGGARTLGCFESLENGAYHFRSGQIMQIQSYAPNATYAAVIGSDRLIHLYWGDVTADNGVDAWLVRLSFDGTLVNQVKYEPGNGDVARDYGSNVIVHPGNRHGTFQVAVEGCYSSFGAVSGLCLGWAGFTMEL